MRNVSSVDFQRPLICLLSPANVDERMALTAGSVHLLLLLATAPDQQLSRSVLVDRLWAGADWSVGRRRLNTAVHRAKSELAHTPAGGCVQSSKNYVSLDVSGLRVDLIDFEASFGRAIDPRPLADDEATELEGAAQSYDTFSFPSASGDWLVSLWARLEGHQIALRTRLAEHRLASGHPYVALRHVDSAIGLDPLREDLHRLAIRCHLARGDRAAALARLEHLKLLLATELDASPMPETIRLFIPDSIGGPVSLEAQSTEVIDLRDTLADARDQLTNLLGAIDDALTSLTSR